MEEHQALMHVWWLDWCGQPCLVLVLHIPVRLCLMMSVQKTQLPQHSRVQCMWGVMLTAVARQWEGLMLLTVCPLSNQLGGHAPSDCMCLLKKSVVLSLPLGVSLTLSHSHTPSRPADRPASRIARLLLITSAQANHSHSPLLSRAHWSPRDENRLFQLWGAVESVCCRLLNCCCSLCPPPPEILLLF